MTSINSIEQYPTHAFASLGEVFLILWRGPIELEVVKRLDSHFGNFCRANPRHSVMVVIEADSPVPSPAVRAALGRTMTNSSSALLASCVVHEGRGFKSVALRSVATGLGLLARPAYPHRIFSLVANGLQWLSDFHPDQLGRTSDMGESNRLINEFRADGIRLAADPQLEDSG